MGPGTEWLSGQYVVVLPTWSVTTTMLGLLTGGCETTGGWLTTGTEATGVVDLETGGCETTGGWLTIGTEMTGVLEVLGVSLVAGAVVFGVVDGGGAGGVTTLVVMKTVVPELWVRVTGQMVVYLVISSVITTGGAEEDGFGVVVATGVVEVLGTSVVAGAVVLGVVELEGGAEDGEWVIMLVVMYVVVPEAWVSVTGQIVVYFVISSVMTTGGCETGVELATGVVDLGTVGVTMLVVMYVVVPDACVSVTGQIVVYAVISSVTTLGPSVVAGLDVATGVVEGEGVATTGGAP